MEKRENEAERRLDTLTQSFHATRAALATVEASLAQVQGEKEKLHVELQGKASKAPLMSIAILRDAAAGLCRK